MELPIASSSELGEAVAQARKSSKLTQADVSKKAGLRQATISKVERGDEGVRFDTVLSILASMDMEIVVRHKDKTGENND